MYERYVKIKSMINRKQKLSIYEQHSYRRLNIVRILNVMQMQKAAVIDSFFLSALFTEGGLLRLVGAVIQDLLD